MYIYIDTHLNIYIYINIHIFNTQVNLNVCQIYSHKLKNNHVNQSRLQ